MKISPTEIIVICILLLVLVSKVAWAQSENDHFQLNGQIIPIFEDGIHDPANETAKALQQPVEAMSEFPRDPAGIINWVETLNNGLIQPRAAVSGPGKMHAVEFDIIFEKTASMPHVRFPHLPHTQWLTCKNCHPGIFLPQKGGNFITMAAIIDGEYCGICHGKVAFPPTECNRCHSVPEKKQK